VKCFIITVTRYFVHVFVKISVSYAQSNNSNYFNHLDNICDCYMVSTRPVVPNRWSMDPQWSTDRFLGVHDQWWF